MEQEKIQFFDHFSDCITVRCSPPFPIGHLRARKPQLIFYAFQPTIQRTRSNNHLFRQNKKWGNIYVPLKLLQFFLIHKSEMCWPFFKFQPISFFRRFYLENHSRRCVKRQSFFGYLTSVRTQEKRYELTYTPPQIQPLLRLILSCKKLRQLQRRGQITLPKCSFPVQVAIFLPLKSQYAYNIEA